MYSRMYEKKKKYQIVILIKYQESALSEYFVIFKMAPVRLNLIGVCSKARLKVVLANPI